MSKSRRKAFGKVLKAIGIFLILLASLFLALNYFANQKLPELLGDSVEIEHFEVFIWSREIRFDRPSIQVDSSTTDTRLQIRSAARTISISGFSLWDILLSNKIDVANLTIDSLGVSILLPEVQPSRSERKEINLFVKEIFTRIEVKELEVLQANILVRKKENLDTLLSTQGFQLTAKNIVVDTATVNRIFPLEFEESSIHLDSFRLRVSDMYVLSGGELFIKDTTLTAHHLHLFSPFSREEFVQRHRHEKAQLDISVSTLTSQQLLWEMSQNRKLSLHSPKTDLEILEILVYKDKKLPAQPLHVKPLLVGLIRGLPFELTLDTLTFRNSYIEYEQFPVEFPRSAKVWFDDLYMTGYNITNDSVRVRERPWTILDTRSRFMSKGDLNVVFKLNMSSADQAFAVSGQLGALPITYVNQVLVPLVGVTAEGSVQQLSFRFDGNDYASEGQLQFNYSDLKISFFNDDRDKSWLKSSLGNLILKNANRPEDSLRYKEGDIYFIRYQNKDFFNFLWNSLRVGLLDVVVPFYGNPDEKDEKRASPKYKLEDE